MPRLTSHSVVKTIKIEDLRTCWATVDLKISPFYVLVIRLAIDILLYILSPNLQNFSNAK